MSATPEFYIGLHRLLVEERSAIDQLLNTPQTDELWDWAKVRLKINQAMEVQLLKDAALAMQARVIAADQAKAEVGG